MSSVDTGAPWAGFLASPSIDVPPTPTYTESGAGYSALPHRKIVVFNLGCFLKSEPRFHVEMWSGRVQTMLIFCFLSYLPCCDHIGCILFPSLQPFVLAKLCLEYSSSALPCMVCSHLQASTQMPLPPWGPPWPRLSLQSAWCCLVSLPPSGIEFWENWYDARLRFIILFPGHSPY